MSSNRFPDIPTFRGFNAPSRVESDIFDLEVEGDLPADLNGTFYRCGPDPQFPPLLGTDLRFNGDGMVSMFRFRDGHVDFRSRYVRTDKFLLERAARRALFGAYRNPYTDDLSVAGKFRGTANTHVMFHDGKLLALKEDSPPVAMNPHTLETYGYYNYGGKFTSETFTAHPKIDPHSGEMLTFGYAAKGVATPDLAYYVIGSDGQIKHEAWLTMPYPAMLHDWVVTEDYVVFPVVPITSDLERLKRKEVAFMWDDTKDVFVGVLPRYGKSEDVRWFRTPLRFAAHFLNGFNEGTKIHIDGIVAEGNLFPFFPDVHGKPFDPKKALARLTRWTIDLSAPDGAFSERILSDVVGEMPKIDERYATRKHLHGFMLCQDPERPYIEGKFGFNAVAHINLETDSTSVYYAGEDCLFQEPVFVPRSPDANEADGYLLVMRNRVSEMASELLVFDVATLTDGPIASVRLPIRLRDAIHGSWVGSDVLPTLELAGN
ncbi:carotenoid oxygenase family protein [Paraburkholderia sediminicola]|uniref:carotenoid oxygenase family protein n=1 Tax=Paraburkholderia sediminicola TaxID=458836 RepID=UPI000E740EA6